MCFMHKLGFAKHELFYKFTLYDTFEFTLSDVLRQKATVGF